MRKLKLYSGMISCIRKYKTIEELNKDLYRYIEVFYNRVKKHSANYWLIPDRREHKYHELGYLALQAIRFCTAGSNRPLI